MSQNRPSNENAPRVPGEESGGTPWGRIVAVVIALILLAIIVPLACQAFVGSGGDSGQQGDSGGDSSPDEATGTSGSASSNPEQSTAADEATGEESTAASGGEESAVTAQLSGVGDQSSADGESVAVRRAEISGASGWLAIHADDESGEVIGFAPLDSGENTDVEVRLDPPVESSRNLYAVIHAEEPADGDFTFPDGDPPVASDGETVAAQIRYTVTGEAVEDASGATQESLADTGGVASPLSIAGALLIAVGWLVSRRLRDGRSG